MKTVAEIKKEFLARLKREYGIKFKMVKIFDSGKFKGLGRIGSAMQEFRNIRYRVSAAGWETRIAKLEIDYALDTFSITA